MIATGLRGVNRGLDKLIQAIKIVSIAFRLDTRVWNLHMQKQSASEYKQQGKNVAYLLLTSFFHSDGNFSRIYFYFSEAQIRQYAMPELNLSVL